MSVNNDSLSSEILDPEYTCTCNRERAEMSLTVDSMTKWISSLEDKVTSSFTRLEDMLTTVLEQQEDLAAKNKELVQCNRVLAEELSKKLFKSEFKARKITNPSAEEVVSGALHPKVIPFVYLENTELSVSSKR